MPPWFFLELFRSRSAPSLSRHFRIRSICPHAEAYHPRHSQTFESLNRLCRRSPVSPENRSGRPVSGVRRRTQGQHVRRSPRPQGAPSPGPDRPHHASNGPPHAWGRFERFQNADARVWLQHKHCGGGFGPMCLAMFRS